jgi:ABC-2 type transport system permease protein
VTGRASFATVARAVAWRTLHNLLHNPALLVPSIVFPLFFFTAFAGGLSRVDAIPGFDFPAGYTAFQFVFVLLQSAAFGGVFTGLSVARDYESNFARRLMLAAPDRRALVAGYAAAAMGRAVLTWLIVTAVALAAGMQVGGGAVDLFGLYGLAALVNLAAALFAIGIALRFRTLQAGPAMQTPTFLVLFLTPVYLPLDLLEGWIHGVARANPVTVLLETGRSLIAGGPEHVALAFAVALALVALFALWALRGLRSAEAAG